MHPDCWDGNQLSLGMWSCWSAQAFCSLGSVENAYCFHNKVFTTCGIQPVISFLHLESSRCRGKTRCQG